MAVSVLNFIITPFSFYNFHNNVTELKLYTCRLMTRLYTITVIYHVFYTIISWLVGVHPLDPPMATTCYNLIVECNKNGNKATSL